MGGAAKSLIRIIITPEGGETPLKVYLRTLPRAGCYTLNLRARPKAPARTAKLVVAIGALRMPTPKLKSPFLKQVKPAAIPMWVVWVREVDAPDGVEAIEWVLYTSLLVEDFEDAMAIVGYYEKRWLIEEWHKVLKTGFQVERRQLKTCDRLEAMMGLMSVEAVRLFQLKGMARTAPEQPATEVIPPKYVMMLKVVRQIVAHDSIDCGRILSGVGQAGRVPGPPPRWGARLDDDLAGLGQAADHDPGRRGYHRRIFIGVMKMMVRTKVQTPGRPRQSPHTNPKRQRGAEIRSNGKPRSAWLDVSGLRQLADEKARDPPSTGVGRA